MRGFSNIEHVEHGLLAEEHEAADAFFVFGGHLHFAEGLFGFEEGFGFDEELVFFFEFGCLHLLQVFFEAFEAFFDLAEVADHEIEFDVLNVAEGIDGMDEWNVVALKGA